MGRRELPQAFEVARDRGNTAHVAADRLDDDRCDLVGVLFDDRPHRVEVVVRCEQGLLDHVRGDARGSRQPKGGGARSGGDEQEVCVAVIAPVHLDDLVAARVAAGESQRAHRRLGARVDHSNHPALQARHHRADELRELHFARRSGAEAEPVADGLLHRVEHLGMCVTEDRGAPRADVVDQRHAVLGDDVRPLCLAHEGRIAADGSEGANRAVDAAGNDLLRGSHELSAALAGASIDLGFGCGGFAGAHERRDSSRQFSGWPL